MNLPTSMKTTKNNVKKFSLPFVEDGENKTISVEVSWDDRCRNGHNTFSITGTISGPRGHDRSGCIHDDVAKHFPELAPLIKWHLVSADGPLHYVANTVYLAGDRDYNGLRKGETKQQTNKDGIPMWERDRVGYEIVSAPDCPSDTVTVSWKPLMVVGEGKNRELDLARKSAVWLDATDAELSVEPDVLEAKLLERLPKLMDEFRAVVESLGFKY